MEFYLSILFTIHRLSRRNHRHISRITCLLFKHNLFDIVCQHSLMFSNQPQQQYLSIFSHQFWCSTRYFQIWIILKHDFGEQDYHYIHQLRACHFRKASLFVVSTIQLTYCLYSDKHSNSYLITFSNYWYSQWVASIN